MKISTAAEFGIAISPYVLSLPSSIVTILLQDDVFLRDLNLPGTSTLSVNDAPAIEIIKLLDSVRKTFKNNVSVGLKNIDGGDVKVVSAGRTIEIQYQDNNGNNRAEKTSILGLIHPEKSVRLEILDKLTKSYGPTHPDETIWRNILIDRSLTDGELWKYIKYIVNTLGPTLKRIESQLFDLVDKTSSSKPPDFLVPDTPEYFENLCGPPPGAMPKKEYLSQISIPRIQRALKYDLVRGFETILPMGIRDDLLVHQFLSDVPEAELQDAIEKLPSFHDPVSRLNLLDLCLPRIQSNPFFARQANRLLKDLTAEKITLRDDIDVNDLFAALLEFVTARIRITQGLREQPVYWQRLCAWTHAGHLVNFLKPWRVTDSLSSWLDTSRVPYHPIAAILELIEAPASTDHWAKKLDVSAYIAHRILDMFSRHPSVSIQEFDVKKFIQSCTTTKAVQSGKFFLMTLPGPLDLDFSPQGFPSSDFEKQKQKDPYLEPADRLIREVGECPDAAIWDRLAILSHLFRPPKKVRDALLKNLLAINPYDLNQNQLESLEQSLQLMAVVSQKLRDKKAAEEILRIILDIVRLRKRRNIEDYLMAALICCMALIDICEAMKLYSDFLFKMGFEVKKGESLRIILEVVRTLEELLPMRSWYFSRVKALCLAG